ncbi:MAG: hypothetical protein ACHQHM_02355 [Thermoanaerobaculales bacterium]
MRTCLRSVPIVAMCFLLACLAHAQEAPVADLTVVPGGFFAAAALAINEHRKPGGNEEHFGDYVVGFDLNATFKPKPVRALDAFSLHVSYVPADLVLDYADPQRANRHNENWLRADGILSRPYLLAHAQADFGTRNRVTVRLGGFLASGLEPLDGAPSLYYLTMPAPLLHTQRWDKGLDATYRYCPRDAPVLTLGLGMLNGQWAVGEASLARLHNSAANSSPSVAARLELRPLALAFSPSVEERSGALVLGIDATAGELGSYWTGAQPLAEKRREDNTTAYLGWTRRVGAGELEGRAFFVRMERNPLGNGTGSHVPAVVTRGYGVEAAWRGLPVAGATVDLYTNAWRMKNESGIPDGEIWPADFGLTTTEIHGFLAGVRWVNPVPISERVLTSVGFSFGQIVPDVPDAWGSSHGLRNLARLVCTVRL